MRKSSACYQLTLSLMLSLHTCYVADDIAGYHFTNHTEGKAPQCSQHNKLQNKKGVVKWLNRELFSTVKLGEDNSYNLTKLQNLIWLLRYNMY